MAEKTVKRGGVSVLDVLTGSLLIGKLLESPYLVNVPFWSFNPFRFSVFIVYTWAFWILLTLGVVFVILGIAGKNSSKGGDSMSKTIENILKRHNLNN